MGEVVDMAYIKSMLLDIAKKQDKLSEAQEDMSSRLNTIDGHLSKISQTVIGDEKFGQKGLVQQVSELNEFVENNKIRDAKILGGLTVIGIIWSLVLKFVFMKS